MKHQARLLSLLSFFIVAQVITTLSYAETRAAVSAANEAVIADDVLGVELRFDGQGTLLSIKSTYSHPVEFPDRRGISKAYIIAEEKAKGNVARYLNQVVTSTRITTEVDESLGKSARSRSNSGESWNMDNTRNVTESLREITTSSASTILSGLRVIERSYNEKMEEVRVTVGINRESQLGAEQLQKGLVNSSPGNKSSQTGQVGFPSVGSELQRSKDADRF